MDDGFAPADEQWNSQTEFGLAIQNQNLNQPNHILRQVLLIQKLLFFIISSIIPK